MRSKFCIAHYLELNIVVTFDLLVTEHSKLSSKHCLARLLSGSCRSLHAEDGSSIQERYSFVSVSHIHGHCS